MKKNIPIILILVLAALLRLYHLTSISLWHDEAFSALMINYPWREMFYRLGLDVHPPMYYIFLRLWHDVFGSGLWSLRGFSVLFGVLTVWAAWLLVKQAFKSEKMAVWAAIFAAINPFQVLFVTEARMYTMGAFFAVLGAYFLVKALQEQKQYFDDKNLRMPNLPKDINLRKNYFCHYLGFIICSAIMILTHYYLLFTAAAICFYGLVYHIYHYRAQLKRYSLLFTSYILIIISFLPWLKVFISQVASVGQSYWIPPMDIWSIPGTLWTMLLGINHDNGNPATRLMMVAVVLFSLFFFYRVLRRNQNFEKWLVVLATVAPFVGAILFALLSYLKGHKTSVYEERYFLFCSVFFTVGLAVWLAELKTKWLATSLFLVYCVFNLYAFTHYWNGLNVDSIPGMNGAAQFLGANAQSSDHVFVATSFEFFNYKYYEQVYYPLPSTLHPLLFTGGRSDISQISSVEGVALLTNADLAANFDSFVHTGDTAWVLWTNAFGSSKPSVPQTWTQVDEKGFADVRPYAGTWIVVTEYKVN